jgi:hypothetical protein
MRVDHIPIYEKLPSPSDSFAPDQEFNPDKVIGMINRAVADTDDPMAYCIQESDALMVCSPGAVHQEGFDENSLYIIGFGTSPIDYEYAVGIVNHLNDEFIRISSYSEKEKHQVISRRLILRAAKVIRWLMVGDVDVQEAKSGSTLTPDKLPKDFK